MRYVVFLAFYIFLAIFRLSYAQLVEIKNFGKNEGNLRMYYHSDFQTDTLPLVVVLHGCSQNAESIANQSGWNVLAKKYKFRVLYPEQKIINNPSLCFNWFKNKDIKRNQGEIFSISEMIVSMRGKFATSKVYMYGVSAGAAMSTAMMCQYPELFDAGAVLAGGPYFGGFTMLSSFSSLVKPINRSPNEWLQGLDSTLTYPKIMVMHGTKDPIVDFKNSFELVKQWSALHHCDTMPEIVEDDLEGLGFIQVKTFCNNQQKQVIKWYILQGISHVLPINPGVHEKEGGETSIFAKDLDFFSTWFIAKDFGLLK